MPGDGFLNVLQVDTETLGFNNKLFEFVTEQIGFFRARGGGTNGDNWSGATANFEESGVDETGNDFVSRVGIDFEFAAESADRRKLVARAELAGDDGLSSSVDNLLVERGAGSEVHVKGQHLAVL